MRKFIRKWVPRKVYILISKYRSIYMWWKRGFLGNSPQLIKESIFKKYGVQNSTWVETGTYLGTTTDFLRKNYPKVYSIEPEPVLFAAAKKRFFGKNVELFNDVSEVVLPKLLPNISGSLNLWLDGHYSSGDTFQGNNSCPIKEELSAISCNLSNFDKVTILIDDVRCFWDDRDSGYEDYPTINLLIDWAETHSFSWRIEHDIFIMRNYQN